MYLDNNYLEHHGVKGMKWGVRRYQNYDGSYTKRGLARFNQASSEYDAAKSKVKSTKSAYKSGKATKQDYKLAKGEVKVAKRKMNSAYDKLKTDKMADEGKKLYKSGKTITSNTKFLALSQAGVMVGSKVAAAIVHNKTGNLVAAGMTERTITLGGTAVNAMLGIKSYSENKKLRAYYAH